MSAADATPPVGAATMAVTIRDGDGRPFAYLVRPAEPLGDLLAFALTKEGEGGPTYRVARDRRGRWRCACEGFLWRGHCKHMKKLRELFDLPEGEIVAKSSKTDDARVSTLARAADAPAADQPALTAQAAARDDTPPAAAQQPMPRTPAVYGAIVRVMAALAKEGISKDRKATGSGASFAFRGIDDVYNALAGILVESRLCVLPRVVSREQVERTSKSGGNLYYTTLTVEYDLVSAEDGSRHTIRTVGEAMDSGDKSSNKGMSAAYKYACVQAFCIPTEGDNDPDATVHEVRPARAAAPAAAPRTDGVHVDPSSHVKPGANGAQQQAAAAPADPDKLALADADARLAAEGLSKPRELLNHIAEQMKANAWTWPANKAEAQKAAAAFEWRRLYDRVQRLMDAVKWDWPDLLAQLGLPEETTQLNAMQLRGGVKALEAAKAEVELMQRLRT